MGSSSRHLQFCQFPQITYLKLVRRAGDGTTGHTRIQAPSSWWPTAAQDNTAHATLMLT